VVGPTYTGVLLTRQGLRQSLLKFKCGLIA